MKLASLLLVCGIFVTALGCDGDDDGADASLGADVTVARADATAGRDAGMVARDDATATNDDATARDDAAAMGDDAAAQPDAAAGLLPFGAACTDSAQCETGLCDRANQGMICTAMCVNGVCPIAGASGCNNRNICRP